MSWSFYDAAGNLLGLGRPGTDGTNGADGALSTIEEVDGSPTDSAVTKLVFPNGTLDITAHVATYTPAASGDIVSGVSGSGHIVVPGMEGSSDRVPASPSSYDDEFEGYSGWTSFGTLDVANASDFPSHLHLKRNAVDSQALDGIYKTAPTAPFTVTTKLADMLFDVQYHFAGLVVGDGTPGKMMTAAVWYVGGVPYTNVSTWTNRTTRSANTDTANTYNWYAPIYLRLVVNSATSFHFETSKNGMVWRRVATAYNPSLASIAVVGIVQGGWNAGITMESVFDWVRFT